MPSSHLSISGISPQIAGLKWQSRNGLRIGRIENLDVILNQPSVSRLHAEFRLTPDGWVVADLGSSNGTFLNEVRVGRTPQRVRIDDIVRCGEMELRVESAVSEAPAPASEKLIEQPEIQTSRTYVRLKATVQQSWEEAAAFLAKHDNSGVGQEQRFLTLLRAGYHLCNSNSLDELLNSILKDTVGVLNAQHGSIVLVDEVSGQLQLRATFPQAEYSQRPRLFSRTLIRRSFSCGQSLWCQDVAGDVELRGTGCIRSGGMSSIICALLRTPRRRLGVMHLDCGPLQKPFSKDDFYLADAIAATVSTGIESAQLVEVQREQAIHTVTALAQAVEFRDEYTGGHTQRVTTYAQLLADELQLGAGEQRLLQIGTPLHDIGKIGIHDNVLRKPGRLTQSEFEHMKSHTVKGEAIVQSIPNLSGVLPIIRSHHERWDGSGYPDKLSRERISLLARVVSVADAFDAMTSHRPYRPALTLDHAFHEIRSKARTHFDPDCVSAFLKLRPAIENSLRTEQAQELDREEMMQTFSRSELNRLMNQAGADSGLVAAGV